MTTTTLRPALYLIPSTMSDAPVGDVIPAENIEIIRGIKHFVVENVRTVRRFLKRCDRDIDIDSLSFTVLDEHTPPEDIPPMLSPLVAIAQERGFEIVPLVGPSSILLSLMGSGFNGQSFAFIGYLPHDSKARSSRLREMERRIRTEFQTQIFIETPYRNNRLIAELISTLPKGLKLCVASDITGPRQKIITLPLEKWAKRQYDYDKTPTIFLLYS